MEGRNAHNGREISERLPVVCDICQVEFLGNPNESGLAHERNLALPSGR